MIDLSHRTVLVAGGSGNVGEGIVAQLRRAGATIVVPSRRPDRAAELLGPDVHLIEGSLTTAEEAGEVLQAVAVGPLTVTDVVASIGSWWSGPPIGGVDPADYDRVLGERLGAHFHLANTFLPVLRSSDVPTPTYTILNGGSATAPVPGSGLISVATAGLLMLAQVMAEEQADGPVAVTTLVAATPILGRDRPQGEAGWLTAETIGAVCATLIGGTRPGPILELTDEDTARALTS